MIYADYPIRVRLVHEALERHFFSVWCCHSRKTVLTMSLYIVSPGQSSCIKLGKRFGGGKHLTAFVILMLFCRITRTIVFLSFQTLIHKSFSICLLLSKHYQVLFGEFKQSLNYYTLERFLIGDDLCNYIWMLL